MPTQPEINAKIVAAKDNPSKWALAGEIVMTIRKLEKELEKARAAQPNETKDIDLSDKAQLKQTVINHLFKESADGNAQASDKLAKLAGLTESQMDVTIQVIDYSLMCTDCHRALPPTTKQPIEQ